MAADAGCGRPGRARALRVTELNHQLERGPDERGHAPERPSRPPSSGSSAGGGVGTICLLLVLVAIDPLLVLGAFLAAGIPVGPPGRRASSLEFRFIARTVAGRPFPRVPPPRLLTGREEAKEVRAFGSEGALRLRHDQRSASVLLALLRRHVRGLRPVVYSLGVVCDHDDRAGRCLFSPLVLFLKDRPDHDRRCGAATGHPPAELLAWKGCSIPFGGLLESSVFLDDLDRFLALAVPAAQPARGTGPTFTSRSRSRTFCPTPTRSRPPAVQDVDLSIGAGEVISSSVRRVRQDHPRQVSPASTPRRRAPSAWDGTDVAEFEPSRTSAAKCLGHLPGLRPRPADGDGRTSASVIRIVPMTKQRRGGAAHRQSSRLPRRPPRRAMTRFSARSRRRHRPVGRAVAAGGPGSCAPGGCATGDSRRAESALDPRAEVPVRRRLRHARGAARPALTSTGTRPRGPLIASS